MRNEEIVKRIRENLLEAGEQVLNNGALATAHPDLLDLRYGNINEHISCQPGAVAYYGGLKIQAESELSDKKSAYEGWEKIKYIEASTTAKKESDKKPSVKDIEAVLYRDNQKVIEQWEREISELKLTVNSLTVWMKAWEQKGFSINSAVSIAELEFRTLPYKKEKEGGIGIGRSKNSADSIRDIIKGSKSSPDGIRDMIKAGEIERKPILE